MFVVFGFCTVTALGMLWAVCVSVTTTVAAAAEECVVGGPSRGLLALSQIACSRRNFRQSNAVGLS